MSIEELQAEVDRSMTVNGWTLAWAIIGAATIFVAMAASQGMQLFVLTVLTVQYLILRPQLAIEDAKREERQRLIDMYIRLTERELERRANGTERQD